jgi:uncharacterized protein YecE (DUF72 family)
MEYASVVPANFRFSVKAPNSITLTHYYSNDNTPAPPNPSFLSAALAQEFLNSLAPMNPFLGPVMFQFGYLNKSMIASRNEFFTRLKEFIQTLPPSYLYAVETRNPNYLLGDYFELLLEHSLVPVFLQGYYMPPIFPLIKKFGELLPKTVVIRLHGPDRPGIEERTGGKWDRIIEPKDDELMPLVQTLSDLLVAKKEVYVNVNNHYEGSAPLTINRIRELMDREGLSY